MAFTLKPAEGAQFVDRKKLLDDMLHDLKSKESDVGYALYGKRRVGKTSIFKELARRLSKTKDVVPVYFSLWELVDESLAGFVKELTVAILDSYKDHLKLHHRAKNLLSASFSIVREAVRGLRVSVTLMDNIELLLTFEKSGEDPSRLIDDLFNLPERLAKATNTKCVLFIDEFPEVANLKNGQKIGEGIIKKIRTIHENHKRTALCVSGSIRSTMKMAVLSQTAAFYRQLIVKDVRPLEKKYIAKMISNNMPKKKFSTQVIDEIYDFSSGIPFYVQFIGKILERHSGAITPKVVGRAILNFLEEEGAIIFTEELESLSPLEKEIVIAMAVEGLHGPSKLARATGNSTATVGVYLGYLEEKGFVQKVERGRYILEDAVFEKWLKYKYQ